MSLERKLSVSPRLMPWIVFLFVGGWILFGGLFHETGYMSTDSMSYLRFAHRFVQTGSVWIDDVFSPTGKSFVGTWPMGYSIVLALVHYVVPSLFWTGKITNLLLFGLSLFAITRLTKNSTNLAYVPMLLMPTWLIFGFTFSEALFICSSLWSLFFVRQLMRDDLTTLVQMATALGLVFCLSLTFTSRYIGLYLLPVIVLAINTIRKSKKRQVWLLVGSTLVFLVIAGAYLYYNLQVTGHLTGKQRIPPPESISGLFKMVLLGFAREIVPIIPIAFKSILASGIFWLIGLSVSISIGFSVFQRFYEETTRGKGVTMDLDSKLLIWSGVIYWISIVTLRMTSYFDPLGFRQLWPGTLLVLIGLGLWVGRNNLYSVTARNGLVTLIVMGCIGTAVNLIVYNRETYQQRSNRILEHYKDVPDHSVAIFGPEDLLYLRPDIQTTYPQAYPISPKTETWEEFLGRMKTPPAGGIWLDYEGARSFLGDKKTFTFDKGVYERFDQRQETDVVPLKN